MLDKNFDIKLTQIQVNSFETMSASFGDSHDLELLDKSLAQITFQKFGADVMYGRKLFAAVAWTLSPVWMLTDWVRVRQNCLISSDFVTK